MTLEMKADRFWQWFDEVKASAGNTPIGTIMEKAGYSVQHTGGGCLAWEKTLPNGGYFWICDEGQGLGVMIDEPFLCGFYDSEGDALADGVAVDLKSALRWADDTLAAMGEKGASPKCQHRDDGRGFCIDCGQVIDAPRPLTDDERRFYGIEEPHEVEDINEAHPFGRTMKGERE